MCDPGRSLPAQEEFQGSPVFQRKVRVLSGLMFETTEPLPAPRSSAPHGLAGQPDHLPPPGPPEKGSVSPAGGTFCHFPRHIFELSFLSLKQGDWAKEGGSEEVTGD